MAADKTIFLNVRLTPTDAAALQGITESSKTTVSDTIRAFIRDRQAGTQTALPGEWSEWDALSELCQQFPQAKPGEVFRLALRVGILQLKKHPELVEKKLCL